MTPYPPSSYLDDLRRHCRTVARQYTDDDLMAEIGQERPYAPDRTDDRAQLVYWRAAVKVEARRRGLIS
jgi:hypothetical protein